MRRGLIILRFMQRAIRVPEGRQENTYRTGNFAIHAKSVIKEGMHAWFCGNGAPEQFSLIRR